MALNARMDLVRQKTKDNSTRMQTRQGNCQPDKQPGVSLGKPARKIYLCLSEKQNAT